MKNISFILLHFIVLTNFLLAQTINLEQYAVNFWHTKLSEYVDINATQLKLMPGYSAIENSSYSLWNIFNGMPGYDTDIYYNPSQYNNFSSAYNMILYNFSISPSVDKLCDLNDAIIKFSDANGTYAWNKTIDTLFSDLAQSKPMVLTSDTNVSIDTTASVFTIKIDAEYQHLLLFYAYPYTHAGNLIDYIPWYSPCILKKAYNNTSNQYWTSAFGANGYLQNITIGLLVAQSGYTCISMSNNDSESNSSLNYSNCISSQSPFIMGAVVLPIKDFVDINTSY